MAVVLLATYSCVQDSTEDLAPVISAPGQDSGEVKALQIALPTPSRTELGDKGLDGKYPVYWCADAGKEDVLSVNGEPTTGIELVNPEVVVLVGSTALESFIFDKKITISIQS